MKNAINENLVSSETVGLRFRAFRSVININQGEMAKLLNISRQSTISDWENDKSEPTIEALQILHNIHLLNIHWLLTGEGLMFLTDQDLKIKKLGNEQSKQQENKDIGFLVKMTIEVLESNTGYSDALESNIVQFHKGVMDERKLIERVSSQDNRFIELERKFTAEINALKSSRPVEGNKETSIPIVPAPTTSTGRKNT